MNDTETILNNSYLSIQKDVLQENAEAVRKSLRPGTEILPVLKGNAYGLGMLEAAAVLAPLPGIRTFVLAHVSEGLELRKAGFGQDILILGSPLPSALSAAADAGLTLTVGRLALLPELARESERIGAPVSVQLKLDTGLQRSGAAPGEELAALLAELTAAGERILLRGVYSHFADTSSPERCARQYELYLRGLEQVEAAGFTVPLRHICDSAASELYPEYHLDAVRLGRRLMMDSPDCPTGLVREPMAWRARILDIRRRAAGTSVGYKDACVLAQDTDVALIGVGYADGLPVAWAERHAPILVKGQRSPLLACCMDQCFADVTGLGCAVGDEVTFFGADHGAVLTSQECAAACGANEGCGITAALSDRVARVWL